ncbi:hypothetical protein HPG69_006219 [Diceros bicornis minor]|uniref:Uncharacterized protein n=1 Tax=Diceros bicornis minor TaxID=77932 RepID=A0A7J7F266_DICBM|nr:hypothetical protein HPG69_006219 [Diceros bicornis minor]
MYKLNGVVFVPSVLTLIGIPGLESVQCWIGIPFCAMYIIALFGNFLLLIIIKFERSLHKPMYLFVAMLGVTDIALKSNRLVTDLLGLDTIHRGIDCWRNQMLQTYKNYMDTWRYLLANAVAEQDRILWLKLKL